MILVPTRCASRGRPCICPVQALLRADIDGFILRASALKIALRWINCAARHAPVMRPSRARHAPGAGPSPALPLPVTRRAPANEREQCSAAGQVLLKLNACVQASAVGL